MKRLSFLLGVVLFLSGCGPTYPKAGMAQSVIQLCKKEYGADVSVQVVGKTIAVYLPLEKLLDSTLKLSPEVGEKLDGVILATSRAVLSTDDPPDFYVVIAQDSRIPGVELRLTRYIQDIRRLNYGDLSRNEYTKRMLLDFGLGFNLTPEGNKSIRPEEVKLEQFLATQIARRIKTALDEESSFKNIVEIKSVQGKFAPVNSATDWGRKEKQGRFVIYVDAREHQAGLLEPLGIPDKEKILGASLGVILEVIQGYHFTRFDGVELHASFLEKPVILARDLLELYRKKKIGLSDLLSPNQFNLSPHDAELLLKK